MAFFVTRPQILGEIPAEWREAALTDAESGSSPDEVWDSLQEAVIDDIGGALSPAYNLPEVDADPAAVPLVRKVRAAARVLTLCRLYRRRRVPDAENPWAAEAARVLKSLERLGQGDDKGPPGPPRAQNTIKVISEPSRLTRTNTTRRRRGL